jgi:hypothetical protein
MAIVRVCHNKESIMPHYDITILGTAIKDYKEIHKLQEQYKVLLLDKASQSKIRYRNAIKTKKGYILIVYKEKHTIQIFTEHLLNSEDIKSYNHL